LTSISLGEIHRQSIFGYTGDGIQVYLIFDLSEKQAVIYHYHNLITANVRNRLAVNKHRKQNFDLE
jgi:hypothetical protein